MLKLRFNRAVLMAGLCLLAVGALIWAFGTKKAEYGHLRVTALDAMTLSPVAGARVVLAEWGLEGVTDKNGRALLFGVPVEKNGALEGLLPQSVGQATLLAYCEGYVPYALFYVQICPGPVRGLNLYLFPDDGSLEGPTTLIEAPPEDWVKEVVQKYGADPES